MSQKNKLHRVYFSFCNRISGRLSTCIPASTPPELWDYMIYVLEHLAIFFPAFCKMGPSVASHWPSDYVGILAWYHVLSTFLLSTSLRADSLHGTQYMATAIFLGV